jgi:uncharacterized protein
MMNKRFGLRYWLNFIAVTVLSLSLGFFIITLYISNHLAQSYLHPARVIPSGNFLKQNNIPYQTIELTTQDGIKLAAWYTPPKPALSSVEGNGALILITHGFGDDRPEDIYAMFAKHGYGVLAWEFRAHGASGGNISTLGYYEQLDVNAALDFAQAQPEVKHIGAWGRSMGSATLILSAAKDPRIEALVSDSSFASLKDVMAVHPPIEFAQPLMLFLWEWSSGADVDQVSPVDEIGKISPRAVFIIDGVKNANDKKSPPYRLYDATNEPKQIWVEEGVSHSGMHGNNPQKYEDQVIDFFDKWLLGK